MRKHLKYLSYVLRHKWFVFVECCKVGMYWRGLVHDMSKFRPSEWFPYVDSFYGGPWPEEDYEPRDMGMRRVRVRCKQDVRNDFNKAWLLHQHRNPHHWQFWCLTQDEDEPKILEMPIKYVFEMMCDWKGAGRAQGHGNDVVPWYLKNRDKMKLHPETRGHIERLIGVPVGERGEWR